MNIEIAKKINKYIDRDVKKGDWVYHATNKGIVYIYEVISFDERDGNSYRYISNKHNGHSKKGVLTLIPNLSDMQELLRKNWISINIGFNNIVIKNQITIEMKGKESSHMFAMSDNPDNFISIEQATRDACIGAIDNGYIKEVE